MAILIACGAGAGPAGGQARQGAPNFEIATEEGAFRGVAEAFITAAAADNRRKLADMLSPAVVGRTGARSLERFLAEEVLAFFKPYTELARSVSVTRTADVRGFAFYMDMVSATGELQPFVIAVIEEGGAKVVANVLVDRLVEGRHCFKCPRVGNARIPDDRSQDQASPAIVARHRHQTRVRERMHGGPDVKARGPARIAELEQLGCIEAAMSLPARGS
jgi:hypothetical protein